MRAPTATKIGHGSSFPEAQCCRCLLHCHLLWPTANVGVFWIDPKVRGSQRRDIHTHNLPVNPELKVCGGLLAPRIPMRLVHWVNCESVDSSPRHRALGHLLDLRIARVVGKVPHWKQWQQTVEFWPSSMVPMPTTTTMPWGPISNRLVLASTMTIC